MRLIDELHIAGVPPRPLWEVLWETRDPSIRPLVQALHVTCGGDYELTTIAMDWEGSPSMLTAIEVYTREWTDAGVSYRIPARHEALVKLIVEVHRQLGTLLDLLTCDHPDVRLATIMALGTTASTPDAAPSSVAESVDDADATRRHRRLVAPSR